MTDITECTSVVKRQNLKSGKENIVKVSSLIGHKNKLDKASEANRERNSSAIIHPHADRVYATGSLPALRAKEHKNVCTAQSRLELQNF